MIWNLTIIKVHIMPIKKTIPPHSGRLRDHIYIYIYIPPHHPHTIIFSTLIMISTRKVVLGLYSFCMLQIIIQDIIIFIVNFIFLFL